LSSGAKTTGQRFGTDPVRLQMDYPRIRHLEAFPVEHEGRAQVVLRDPMQISPRLLALSPELFSLLPLFDGTNSLLDIQEEVSRRSNRPLFRSELDAILGALDQALFLDNENFRKRLAEVAWAFRRDTVRSCSHAGISYPAEPLQLLEQLSSFYEHPEGAGLPSGIRQGRVRGLVAPHIDLRSGGPAYSHAYRALAEGEKPDLFVIFGTGHMGLPQLFSPSNKDFDTPLGRALCDREFLGLLRNELPGGVFAEDLSHRTEHTIEFQVLFLQHLFREQKISILPVLTSFSYRDVNPLTSDPERISWLECFLESFRRVEEVYGGRVCLIASADLAHIGPRYGDRLAPDASLLEKVMTQDREILAPVCAGDWKTFSSLIESERDSRRVCGFAPIYSLLRLAGDARGTLLAHSHSVLDQHGSFVTYASLVLERQGK
jgi:MEMO1 family protein